MFLYLRGNKFVSVYVALLLFNVNTVFAITSVSEDAPLKYLEFVLPTEKIINKKIKLIIINLYVSIKIIK